MGHCDLGVPITGTDSGCAQTSLKVPRLGVPRLGMPRPGATRPVFFLLYSCSRGCTIIIRTGILLHTSKTIAPRVKSQARGQNNWSRALKWGIVRLCSLSTFWDTTVFMKMWVFHFLRFCKKMMISLYKNAKNAKT